MSRGLPNKVKKCLEKAIDSSLLAVETYNKPAIKFKSGGYIVLMNIAWTALFHAIFFRRKVNPFYRQANSVRYLKVDGDYRYWELHTCLREYFLADTMNPIRKNLEFFIKLRNRIEHKSLPEIDSNIFGECQSMLFNFDKFIETEFGEKYCIREALTFSLQLFPSKSALSQSIKTNQVAKEVQTFIENYRSSISTDVMESGKYAFKAFLIQVSNHENNETLPVQFVQWDNLTDGEKNKARKVVAMVKQKQTEIPVVNAGYLKPGEVVSEVQKGLGDRKVKNNGKVVDYFNMTTHTRAWRKYGVRPISKSNNPSRTKKQYCIYDRAHKDYLYREEWVKLLVEELSNEEMYKSLWMKKPNS